MERERGGLPPGVSADELFEASPDGLLVVAADGTILSANSGVTQVLGYAPQDLVGRAVELLVPAGVRDRHRAHRAAFAAAPRARGMASGLELQATDSQGRLVAVDVMLGPLESAGEGCVLVALRDARERREREDAWVHRALHDPLTGLANRSLVLDRLHQSLVRTRRSGSRVAVFFLDLDGFKAINDVHGHVMGDEVLVTAAARLTAAVRAGDTVGRIGGDEFLVVVEEPDPVGDLATHAERLRESVSAPLEVGGVPLSLGCSIGVAVSSGSDDVSALVSAADHAMYADKQSRRAAREDHVVRLPDVLPQS